MGELSGKVAIITGGGKGIGRVLAEAFAGAGAAVTITGRTASALEETVAGIRAAGGTADAHPGDVSDPAAVAEAVAAVLRRSGAIHILINNAGIEGPTAPVHEVSPAAWEEVMAIKVRGAFLMTRAVAPHMIAVQSGHILFISALGGGLRAYPLRAPYAVSNAAALALMQTVAAELGPHGIRVNAITPGPVKGERLDRVFRTRAQQLGTTPETIAQGLAGKMLNRRLVDAADIARAALFLCSPAADSIVGQSLNMTGGIEILF